MNKGLFCSLATAGILGAACLIAAGITAGCSSYRMGSVMHPGIETIAVGPIINKTDDPLLAAELRRNLTRGFMHDGSLTVVSVEKADAVLGCTLLETTNRRLADVRKRGEDERDRDREAYQTALYRVEVAAQWEMTVPGRTDPLLVVTESRAGSDYSPLPDLSIARAKGHRLAVAELARRIVSAVTEAW